MTTAATIAISVCGLLIAVFGIVGTFSALRAWSNSNENKARIERLEDERDGFLRTNQEYRAELDWKDAQAREREADHKATVAKLTGQLDALQGELVRGLVESIRQAMADALEEVLHRSEVTR